jgi:hypothetical protein
MKPEEKQPDMLDQAIEEIRNEPLNPEAVSRATERVWERLREIPAGEAISGCRDYEALIPGFVAGWLNPAKALLLEDHTHECPSCRKALAAARGQKVVSVSTAPRARPLWRYVPRWAAAAAVMVAAGLGAIWTLHEFAVPAGPRATVQSVDGVLYAVAGGTIRPVIAGTPLVDGEQVRTARGAAAMVRLRDGSLVEMRERTGLSVSERRQGATIHLDGGSVIVQAAKQRSKQLVVSTPDCRVSVKGTIFSVNRGMKGSRVAVIEGQVQVAQGNTTQMLRPGDQASTNPGIAAVAIQDEISWSRNSEQYVALLQEFAALGRKLEAIPQPGVRNSSRLLAYVPAGTVFYVAIPNVSGMLSEAQRIFQDQLVQSQVLRQWWSERMKTPDAERRFNEGLDRIRTFSAYLGPEIVIAASSAQHAAPVFLAEAARTDFRSYVESEAVRNGVPVRFTDNPAQETGGRGLLILLRNDLVAASTDPAVLTAVSALMSQQSPNAFSGSPFRARIAKAYGDGAGWLLCADLGALVLAKGSNEKLHTLGVDDVRYLVVNHKEVAGRAHNTAELTFAGARRGVTSWLAQPAPARSLEFFSPDASGVTVVLAKNASGMLEDMLRMLPSQVTANEIAEFESKAGISLLTDLAGPLGGEIAVGLDGPLLPQPSWKLVMEVYDPLRLEQTIETLADRANRESGGKVNVRIDREQAGGRTFYAMRGLKMGQEAHYTFVDGYLIAAPNRPLLLQAIGYRDTGYSLPKSAKFRALLPQDGHLNFSAAVYHDLSAAVNTASGILSGTVNLTDSQKQNLQALTAQAKPTLVLAYGEADRIEIASAGTFFGFSLENLFGMQKMMRK